MEGRKRSRALSRTVYSAQKRLLAFLLAMAMILTNVGADMNTALAASSSESVTFKMCIRDSPKGLCGQGRAAVCGCDHEL